MLRLEVMDGLGLYGGGPLEVPPELGLQAVSACGREAEVATCSPDWYAWDQV